MFSKKKNTSKLDQDQRELYENARRRMLEKRHLFHHFVIFLVGSILLIVVNVVIGFKEDFMPLGYNWFVWAILLWAFFFLIHFFNVLVINSFMGKEWEQKQMEKLVRKQRERIVELDTEVQQQHPLPTKPIGTSPSSEQDKDNNIQFPDRPLNH